MRRESPIRERATPKEPHPWDAFLKARLRCLAWLRDERQETTEQIVETMRMDPRQVEMVLAHYDATRLAEARRTRG
jgi:hypothetical protein